MKRTIFAFALLLTLSFYLSGMAAASVKTGKMMTATGKITSIDPQGQAITISAYSPKGPLDVGTVVNKDTVVDVKGHNASLKDLKLGDKVTVRYRKSDDLYAKEIMKK